MPRGGYRGGHRPRESVRLRLDVRYAQKLETLAEVLGIAARRRSATREEIEAELVERLIDAAYGQVQEETTRPRAGDRASASADEW